MTLQMDAIDNDKQYHQNFRIMIELHNFETAPRHLPFMFYACVPLIDVCFMTFSHWMSCSPCPSLIKSSHFIALAPSGVDHNNTMVFYASLPAWSEFLGPWTDLRNNRADLWNNCMVLILFIQTIQTVQKQTRLSQLAKTTNVWFNYFSQAVLGKDL